QHSDEHSKPATTQYAFDTLEDLPSDDVPGDGAGEHAGRDAGLGGAAIRRSDVQARGRAADGLYSSLGDGSRAVPSAGRRVGLDEPEPHRPTRDFRITEAHQIGVGGLHEKARANIEAIRLLKGLEAEH